MIYIGIDPGLDGAIAIVGEGAEVHPMPTTQGKKKRALNIASIEAALSANRMGVAVIEQQGVRPGQGSVSGFTIGTNYGILIGLLAGLGIKYEIVRPQAWHKVMLAGTDGSKGASIQRAQALFPGVSLLASDHPRATDHDGMAEALLLAEYGRRIGL